MWEKFKQIWTVPELRKSILFVLGMLVLFRFVAHIPVPGVDLVKLRLFLESNQVFGLLNIFSGGTFENFSVVLMGVAPYITASIILQLLQMIVPQLEELGKEGEQGQQKINQYTRLLAVPLALLQSYGMITLLRTSAQGVIGDLSAFQIITIMITITGGTMFLMWIGELISEKKIGNGISLLIFAGIVSSLPTYAQQLYATYDQSQLFDTVLFVALALITIIGVVVITQGQRNIPVQYARQMRGTRMTAASTSFLPLKVNMAGVIPIIFAISMILFPPMIAQFLVKAKTAWIVSAAEWVIRTFQNQLVYGVIYFLLVIGFTFFYTAVIFQPDKVAENLQKQGGFIPGIRPGTATSAYLGQVMVRIVLAGALFLGIIAVLPLAVQQFLTHTRSLVVGGTSLLIVVSVAIEIVNQIDAQLTMRQYDRV
ncbi:MAG: preprotein translocase subunit SecY, preprotein translocase subunit SecY [Candidatus Magasanikbacteria bacterium]|nr:preprotein translocase subunit SecY, preprotein translocase subunit SecY [Candidatus Magasanikbacteria bacterium]